jgi:hypothetical protein
MSVVPVCGLSESSTNCPIFGLANSGSTEVTATPDTQWMYYREVTIKESSGTTLTNYQVLVELKPSNFPDKAKSDGSDLRFVEDGKELGYWIEDYDAGAKTAKIWVKVSNIPANGEAKIKMYYGKDTAGSVSDGDATFEFFDDFGGTSLDWNKWRKAGGDLADAEITVSSSILTIEGSGTDNEYLESKTFTTSMPVIFTTKQRDYTAVHYPCEFGFGYRHHGGSSNCVLKLIYTADEFCLHNHAGTGESYTSRVPDDDEYHIWDLVWTSGKTELFRDEYIQGSLTTNIPSTTLHISLGHPETVAPNPWKGSFDWIFVRKYATPEPTIILSQELSTQKDSSLTPTPTPPEGIYDRALNQSEIRADMDECAPTLATIQVPIDSTGSRTTPTINVNGVDYAVVGVMYVDSPDSPLDAAGSDLPQGITVDLEELGLAYVENIYIATQNAWYFDMPNDIKVATLVCEYAEGGPPTTLDLIMGVNTAEWAWENPTQAAAFGAQPPHSMPPVITSTPTTGDSDQEYIAHTYAASVSLDPTRTLSNLRLELVDANQLLAYRSPLNGVPIEKCRPMEETIVIGVNDMEIFFKIKGEVDGNCEIYEKVVKDNTGYGFEGKDMTCKIPMGAITGDSPLSDNIKDYCNGPLADAIRELTKEVKENG